MRKFLAGCLILVGLLFALLIWERVFVEGSIGVPGLVGLALVALAFAMLLVSFLLHGTRYQRAVGNAWLAIVSVAITYAFVDVTAGLLLIKPLSPPLVPDEFRHHRLVPDSFAQFTHRDFSYVQRVNKLGLRGAEITRAKPADTRRILMLGDSFTMGKGVEDDQTFSVLVEQSLNRRLAACGGPAVQVLNGGVDSYAPILSLVQLRRDLAPLMPDLVVLNLDLGDLVQEGVYRKIAQYGPSGELIGVPQLDPRKASMTERIRNWIERHLYLTRLAFYYANRVGDYREISVREVVTQASRETVAHTLVDDTVDRQSQWADLFASITGIRETAAGIPAEFLLTTYPWGHQVNEREWVPGRLAFMEEGAVASDRSVERMTGLAAELDIEFLNLYPLFRAYRGDAPLYFQYDNHLTRRGHELMAEGISAELATRFTDGWCGNARLQAP